MGADFVIDIPAQTFVVEKVIAYEIHQFLDVHRVMAVLFADTRIIDIEQTDKILSHRFPETLEEAGHLSGRVAASGVHQVHKEVLSLLLYALFLRFDRLRERLDIHRGSIRGGRVAGDGVSCGGSETVLLLRQFRHKGSGRGIGTGYCRRGLRSGAAGRWEGQGPQTGLPGRGSPEITEQRVQFGKLQRCILLNEVHHIHPLPEPLLLILADERGKGLAIEEVVVEEVHVFVRSHLLGLVLAEGIDHPGLGRGRAYELAHRGSCHRRIVHGPVGQGGQHGRFRGRICLREARQEAGKAYRRLWLCHGSGSGFSCRLRSIRSSNFRG